MKTAFSALAAVLVLTSTCVAQEAAFSLKLSGVLSSKLAPDTELRFWYPSSDTSDWAKFSVDELPLTLPAAQFQGRQWHVDFVSISTHSHFSITLSEDLFDKPRKIDIKLDAPVGHIRPIFGFARDIRYTAQVTKRIRYRSLPGWDAKTQKLTRSVVPSMKIQCLDDAAVVHDAPMEDGCMGVRWFAIIDDSVKLVDGSTYRMTVEYDSGGVFPSDTASFDFTYLRDLHGD